LFFVSQLGLHIFIVNILFIDFKYTQLLRWGFKLTN